MPAHLAAELLCCIVSLFAGGAITWRLLGRSRRGYFRRLAQELTDGVHERCSSYKRLEDRIDAVIAEFDQREFELRNEFAEGIRVVEEPSVPEAEVGAAPEAAAEADALSWMDSCDVPGDPNFGVIDETSFVGLPVPEGAIPDDAGTTVDRFAQSLQIFQREKSDELERQRGWIGTLEGRIQALESLTQELARRERGVSESRGAGAAESAAAPNAESAIWAQNLQAVYDRISRSEQGLAAWHAQQEEMARERIATIESAREIAESIRVGLQRNPEAEASASSVRARAEELARDIVKLQATIARREENTPRPIAAAPRVAPAKSARPPSVDSRAPRRVAAEPLPTAAPVSADRAPAAAPTPIRENPIALREVARPVVGVDDLPGLVDTTFGEAPGAGESTLEGPSQIAQLMRSLEIARGDADSYRRKLHEQNSQFTAAYAMLDRIRPFVEALESDFAAHGREGGKPS
jgi:hypothetical protein